MPIVMFLPLLKARNVMKDDSYVGDHFGASCHLITRPSVKTGLTSQRQTYMGTLRLSFVNQYARQSHLVTFVVKNKRLHHARFRVPISGRLLKGALIVHASVIHVM
jgi:hypothetical protein